MNDVVPIFSVLHQAPGHVSHKLFEQWVYKPEGTAWWQVPFDEGVIVAVWATSSYNESFLKFALRDAEGRIVVVDAKDCIF